VVKGGAALDLAAGKTYVTHILQKLNLRDRVQAVVLAYQAGIFPEEPAEAD
jgi:hypothetical protein